MAPIDALFVLLALLAIVVLGGALLAHLEYRRKFPQAKGLQLDYIGQSWDCLRVEGESDRKYRRRLRDHVTTLRRDVRAAGARW